MSGLWNLYRAPYLQVTTAAIEQIWEHIKRQDSRGCTAQAVELSRRRSFGSKKKKQRQGLPATQFRQTELSSAIVLVRLPGSSAGARPGSPERPMRVLG